MMLSIKVLYGHPQIISLLETSNIAQLEPFMPLRCPEGGGKRTTYNLILCTAELALRNGGGGLKDSNLRAGEIAQWVGIAQWIVQGFALHMANLGSALSNAYGPLSDHLQA